MSKFKDNLTNKIIEFEKLRKTGNPLDIKEDPEAAKNEDLQVYSGEVQDFLTFLRCFTLNTQQI